ncbi:BLUF domain-containing protein [Jiella sp. MQZ9-1]|uniref:BLUF domain-containing protein n=1 Tax=Jiella flava TaxID=2816857 RepID=A0A939FZL0_9HYPH|nr:BLUF domain-containing protein [Jiella flava]MBO0664500.1 BLUF domain-containing protein [Jiella flava]MCD2473136.1 BLUF domain-containing protein [Jiella flava]
MTLYRLAYVSKPAPTLAPSDVAAIAAAARRRNPALDVTGLLIHEFSRFIQLLEGPIDALETLMTAIIADPRHHDIRIFLQQSAETRSLSRWILWTDFDRMALTAEEMEVHEEIVRGALASLAELDAERCQAAPPAAI